MILPKKKQQKIKKQKTKKQTKKYPAKYSRMIQFHRDQNTLVSYGRN